MLKQTGCRGAHPLGVPRCCFNTGGSRPASRPTFCSSKINFGRSRPARRVTFLARPRKVTKRKPWIPCRLALLPQGTLRRTDECRPDKNSGLKPLKQFVRLIGIHPSGSGGDGTGCWPLAGKAQLVPKAE